ncbi:MAG: glycine zipper 2TM domain-containing protein [Novosphingobium sp.]|nr:glycine zipper 2TM domain-containing protein [Novosphingobium sp.]MCP5402280.1 glycine zipper 2TM domain-containing protein [Novosphingobium sp.]
MRKMVLAISLTAIALPAAPALADPPPWAPAHGQRAQRIYDSDGRYIQPRRLTRNDRVWRGRDGRYYCRRDNGTTGLVIGAALGGLLGNQVAGKGDKTLGTIIGAVGGGLLGRSIDRGDLKCR